ncbi:MAG: hypothetical protein C5B52_08775 [Bacteroidetes bacterium]|nr:MAG: hypothetical protein C5B52_08775 [Bacteroidota bacterium]
MRVRNAEKWKSPELRITLEDAKELLKEIYELQQKSHEVIRLEEVKPIEETIKINLDGGAF